MSVQSECEVGVILFWFLSWASGSREETTSYSAVWSLLGSLLVVLSLYHNIIMIIVL